MILQAEENTNHQQTPDTGTMRELARNKQKPLSSFCVLNQKGQHPRGRSGSSPNKCMLQDSLTSLTLFPRNSYTILSKNGLVCG